MSHRALTVTPLQGQRRVLAPPSENGLVLSASVIEAAAFLTLSENVVLLFEGGCKQRAKNTVFRTAKKFSLLTSLTEKDAIVNSDIIPPLQNPTMTTKKKNAETKTKLHVSFN